MNSIQLGLAAFSISSLMLSLWAKFSLKKTRLSRVLFPLALIYNFSFGCLHLYFFETGEIPIIGEIDNPILASLSLVMACAYSYAIPWSWLSEAKSDLNQSEGTKQKFASTIIVIERLIHFLKITVVILGSALFYSVLLIALATQIIPLDAVEDTHYAIGCALLYLTLVGIGVILVRLHEKKKSVFSENKDIK